MDVVFECNERCARAATLTRSAVWSETGQLAMRNTNAEVLVHLLRGESVALRKAGLHDL